MPPCTPPGVSNNRGSLINHCVTIAPVCLLLLSQLLLSACGFDWWDWEMICLLLGRWVGHFNSICAKTLWAYHHRQHLMCQTRFTVWCRKHYAGWHKCRRIAFLRQATYKKHFILIVTCKKGCANDCGAAPSAVNHSICGSAGSSSYINELALHGLP